MASIYQNAILTIAATRSKESAGGCYSTTDTKFLAKCVPETDIYVRRRPPKFPTHWSQKDSADMPLLNRAWIYQEMRLSCRVLHFCAQEVIWECQDTRRSESRCSEEILGRDESRYAHTMYEAVPYWKLAENPRRLWYRTVQEYSRLKLTFTKDTMPALAALTQNMEVLRTNDPFIAGLWEKTFLFDLLWMVWPKPKSGRSVTHPAPSWSWICARSQVMWESSVDHVLPKVKVVHINFSTVGPACMGDIQEAAIVLHVPLLEATVEKNRVVLGSEYETIKIYDSKPDYDYQAPGKNQVRSGTDVFVMPIGVTGMNHCHIGIVLRYRQDTSVYERIGYVELRHRDLERNRDNSLDDAPEWRHAQSTRENRVDAVTALLTSLPHSNITVV